MAGSGDPHCFALAILLALDPSRPRQTARLIGELEHRAKKWAPFFGVKRCDNKDSEHRAKKWAPVFGIRRCDNKDSERAGGSHLALSALAQIYGKATVPMLYDIPATLFLVGALVIAIVIALGVQQLIHRHYGSANLTSHNEVGGIIVMVVANIYAVLLGFMTVVAWEHFQEARGIVVSEADASIDAWHTAVGWPEPVRQCVRQDMIAYAEIMVTQEWAAMKNGRSEAAAGKVSLNALETTGGFIPKDGRETNAQSLTMQQLGILHDAWQRRIASNEAGVVGFEWIVLFIGAGSTISLFWLFGSKSRLCTWS